jgi:uncharacterized protein with GYD domain
LTTSPPGATVPSMSRYLVEASYAPEGLAGLLTDGGSGRVAAVTAAVEGLGGTVESFDFAFGGTDAYVVIDFPDHVSAAALSLAVGATGKASTKVTVLLTAEEIDAATRLHPDYRPPGG